MHCVRTGHLPPLLVDEHGKSRWLEEGNGLPIGMQIIGKHFDEATILRVAYAYEQATEWHKRKPKL